MAASTLLYGGTVLVHDEHDNVSAIQADVLITGNKIARIAPGIPKDQAAETIDCTNKLISPGLVDTHRHMWQTLLKGRHANELLLEYMWTGNFQSSNHSAADIFWAQLGGCLESLEAGTTTYVDHAHMNYSPENNHAAIAATVASGIRCVFGYAPTPRVASWQPFEMEPKLLDDWVMTTFEELAAKAPFGDGRVSLGMSFDGLFLPKEVVQGLFGKAKDLGVKTITTHAVRGPIFGERSNIALLNSYGLLDSNILLSHASNPLPEDIELIKKSGAQVSTTPSTELQMAHGVPVALNGDYDIDSHCSLGVDCHSATSSSIIAEMKLLLQSARGMRNAHFTTIGNAPATVWKTVQDVFNLGTINGARAIGMDKELGSLQEGKFADLLVWDMLSPSMVCAAQQDPIAALVLHSSPKDLVMTIVDGIVRKDERGLRSVRLGEGDGAWAGEKKEVGWREVAEEMIKRREALQSKIDKLDLEAAGEETIKLFHVDESKISDQL